MAQMGRPGLSASQKSEVWRRWKSGQSHSDIGRALGKHPASIHGIIAANGGIVPMPRRRSRWALGWEEREEISRGIAAGKSIRIIAAAVERAPSTVSREIARNGGRQKYRANVADQAAWTRARRPKCCRLASNLRLRRVVAGKLRLKWSPEQISGWLKREYALLGNMQISHETIYRTLFIQARGALNKDLIAHLRTRRMMRAIQEGKHTRSAERPDRRRRIHQRAACRDRGPRRSRPLGGRLDLGFEQHAHRHVGGAAVSVHDAREAQWQRHRHRCQSADQPGETTPLRGAVVPYLGSRNGASSAQGILDRN